MLFRSGSHIRHNVVMFGEAAPKYQYISQAIEHCEQFIAIGTSGSVIDIVDLASHFDDSLLINPVSEVYMNALGSQNRSIDSYFSHFIQKTAVDSIKLMNDWIKSYYE